MPNIQGQKKWSEVRLLETYELARGGVNGNLNEQAKALADRTEFLNQEKASKSEIVQGVFEFGTYAEFNEAKINLPPNCTVVIGEENTTGTGQWGIGNNRWNGTTLTKSAFDPFQQANIYINGFSSLTKNSTVLYPFSSLKRNNIEESDVVATHEKYLKPYILNASVTGADPSKYYRIQQVSHPNNATVPNRWIFEVLNRTNFDTAETSEKTISVVFPIVANTGIKTFSVVDGDIAIAVTVDTSKIPASDLYSVAPENSSYTYIIDPSCYIFSSVKKSEITAYVDKYSSLTKNSTVLYPFSTTKRNNVVESSLGSHINIIRDLILDVRVMNADPKKYYRLQQMTNPTYPTNANLWIFEVLNRTSFDITETSEKTISAVFPIVPNTGIKTFSVNDGDTVIAVTVDTSKVSVNNFYSVTSDNFSYTYIIDPSLYYYAAVSSEKLNAEVEKFSQFVKPVQLINLLKDLRNPIQSVQIKLIGDSITFGMGATGNGSGTYTVATSKTWANILRDYFGTAFCTSARYGDDTIINDGAAWYSQAGVSVISSNLSYFKFINTATGKVFSDSEMNAKVGTNITSPSGTFLDLFSKASASTNNPDAIEFEFVGSSFKINFAKLSYGDANTANISVYVNDEMFSGFNVYSPSASFGHSTIVSNLPVGRNKIRIENETNVPNLMARLVSIEAERKINVINQGVSGSNTKTWLDNNWIQSKVNPSDNYVFVQLGTNDRHTTKKIGQFKNQYLTLLDRISVASPTSGVIVMSPPAVTQNEDPIQTVYQFRISDLNYCLSEIAKLRKLSFISNFEVTSKMKAKGEVFLSDGLHPNDYGYNVIADHIINQIINA